jgi:cytochrome c-type biogenesis protein CcmH
MTTLALGLVGLMLAAQPAVPAVPEAPATVVLPVALEREAKVIEHLVIAPCCWTQPVSDHQSQASDEVKQQLRAWLAAGMTRQQVLDAFVERYGPRILAEPPNRGFGRFLYVTPVAVFGLSAVGLFVLVRKLTAGRNAEPDSVASQAAAPRETAVDRTYEERLDDELRDLD